MNNEIMTAGSFAENLQEGRLDAAEEERIWKLLDKRRRERIKRKERECSCTCLLDLAEREMEKLREIRMEEMKKNLDSVIKQRFQENRTAAKDLSCLSEDDIRRFLIHEAEHHFTDTKGWIRFVGVLQEAVFAAENIGMDFGSYKQLFHNCHKNAVFNINMPYTDEEKKKLTGWLDKNRADMQALAVDLWLTGGISSAEIIGLKKEGLLDSEGRQSKNPAVLKKNDAEWYLPLAGRRGKIIQDALKLQEDNSIESEYIFVSAGDGVEGKKLPFLSVQKKLSDICRLLEIKYCPTKIREAASWNVD